MAHGTVVLWIFRKYFADIFIVDYVQIYRNMIIIASPLRMHIPTFIAMSAYNENDDNYKNYDQDTNHRSYNTTN